MKNGWLIVAAVVLFLWWRSAQTAASPATSTTGGTIGNTSTGGKAPTAYEQWMRKNYPERFRDVMQSNPAKFWEGLGVDAGSLGSNLPWGIWDEYLGAPGGVNPATGTTFNPFGAIGASNGTSGGGASWSISDFPEVGVSHRPNSSSNG